MVSLRDNLFSASFMSGLIKGASMLAMLALMMMIGRYGGADALGVYSLGLTIISMILLPLMLGLPAFMMREVGYHFHHGELDVPRFRCDFQASLLIITLIGLFISVVLFSTAEYVSIHLFDSELLTGVLRPASVALLPLALIILHTSLLQGAHRQNIALTLQALCVPLATLLLSVVLLMSENADATLASEIMVYYAAIAWICCFLSAALWLRVAGGVYKQFSFRDVFARLDSGLLGQGVPFLLAGIGITILNMTDIVMLGLLSTDQQTGFYSAASKLAAGLSLVLFSVNNILGPRLASSFSAGDMDSFSRYVRSGTLLAFMPTLLLAIVMFLFSTKLLNLFGVGFEQAQWIFAILLLGNLINALAGPVGWVLNMAKHERLFQKIILQSALLNVVLNYFLISAYGAVGAAVATMITTALWNIRSALAAYSRLGVCTVVGLNFLLKRDGHE